MINETPKEAARSLSKSVLDDGFELVALHEYTDENGEVLYWRIRCKHPVKKEKWIRPMRLGPAGYELKDPKFPNGKPLYALHLIAANPDKEIWVVEGEQKADELNKLGLIATTSGGATSASATDWEPLRGRNIRIWADNDEAGKSYAKEVTGKLRSMGCIVSCIDVETLGLGPKEDCVDWLGTHPKATGADIEALPNLPGIEQENSIEKHQHDGKDGKDGISAKQPLSNSLIKLAEEHCEFFHDERGAAYCVLSQQKIRRILKLQSRDFRKWLAGSYYRETKEAANDNAISSVITILDARATYDGEMHELSNRYAMHDGDIYIDTADKNCTVIKITPSGWEIMQSPPILFRRYSHQKPLPTPAIGGRLSSLHDHLSIKSDNDKWLVEAWLVACAFPSMPRPAILFHGSQGSSKTTSARCLKSIVDPSLTESVDLGKSPSELAQILDHHGIPSFDNLSNISGWAADLLCRAVSGGAFSKRELYSDDNDIILVFKRAMILTGINIPTHAPDLLDRMLLIELERISPDKRVDETTFWLNFDAHKPMLFGALLDAVVGTLKHLPTIKLNRMPRMADFARIACAYAEYTGFGTDKMLDVIMQHTVRQTEEVFDSDPLAPYIRGFVKKRKHWEGTPSELLTLLNQSVPKPRPDGYPKNASGLSRQLNVLKASLNDVGISITTSKSGEGRKIIIEQVAEMPSLPSLPSLICNFNELASDGIIMSSSPPVTEACVDIPSDRNEKTVNDVWMI